MRGSAPACGTGISFMRGSAPACGTGISFMRGPAAPDQPLTSPILHGFYKHFLPEKGTACQTGGGLHTAALPWEGAEGGAFGAPHGGFCRGGLQHAGPPSLACSAFSWQKMLVKTMQNVAGRWPAGGRPGAGRGPAGGWRNK